MQAEILGCLHKFLGAPGNNLNVISFLTFCSSSLYSFVLFSESFAYVNTEKNTSITQPKQYFLLPFSDFSAIVSYSVK